MRQYKLYSLIILVMLLLCSYGYCISDEFEEAVNLVNQGKYEEAVDILEKLHSEDPDSIEIKFNLGVAYIQLEKYNLAENCFIKVSQKSPEFLPAHYYLAMLYERKEMNTDAINEWKKVIELTEESKLKELANKHISQLELKNEKKEKE